jgi:putative sigma-54 modulation protein
VLVHYEVMEAAETDVQRPDYKVVRSSKFFAKPMTVDQAILQMNLLGNDFLVFTNADSQHVNVVYKRGDGNYGLIETGRSAE